MVLLEKAGGRASAFGGAAVMAELAMVNAAKAPAAAFCNSKTGFTGLGPFSVRNPTSDETRERRENNEHYRLPWF